FNLKSLEEAYIPNFKAEVKEAINRVLGGEEIKLTKGSFEKLLKRDREEFLPYIKDTLEKADLIIKDKENALIFVKDIGKKSYFTSVAKNANNEWVISTNSLKTLNTLKNRVDDNGEVLYLSKEAPNILAEAFTKRAFSNELAKDIIPQKPQQKALNLQEIEQSLKARKSQINDEISANDKAFKENLKEVSKVNPILEALKKEWEALEPTIVTWTHTDYSKAKPKKYYKRKPNLSNLWHIEETLDVYKGYARESDRHANQVAREIALLEKYVKLLKDKEAEVKAFKAKAEADENALILESRIIPIYNQLREAFKKGHHTTKQILEANNIKQDSVQAKEVIDSIAQTRQYLEDTFNIKPLEEFGTNYAEFYRDGKGAVEKLLKEAEDFKQRGEKGEFKGQVAGAFYKEGLGEIDLVWGEAGSGKSDGFGLAKIVKYHPEVIDKLDDIIANTSIVKESDNRYHLENENYKLAIRKDFEGEKTNWLLTAFEKKDSIARRRTDLPSTQSEAEKTTSANANEIIPQEIEQAEIKKLLEEYGEQISSNYPQETARLILEQNKNDGIVLSGFKIKGKSYDPEIEAMQFKTKKAEREFESLMESYDIKGDFLNFKEAYSFKPNDEAFLQYLAKYEGDENAKLALAYNLAKQLVMRRGGGRAEVYTTDFLRQMHILENQNSTTLHSNPHLGAGLVGGVLNGVEQDENGNLSFDPVKFAMGFLGGSGGSFALKKGFQILEKNPELKEKIINELAHTLAQGFEKAREKYSLLNLLEPRYIVKNEKGRKIQAKTMLKELEREQKGLYNVAFNGKNASLIKQDLQSVESAIAFMQGTRYKGAKHERIKHLTDPSKEGYVTDLEFVNLGKSIREFLKNYEPFIDTNGARLYEWENKDKVRFRVVVNDVADMDSNPTTATEEIITFYSDRNLKEKMNFKNPLLKDTIAESTMQGEALSKEL
ncbi:PBECR2 nuclease fold domain-containing protein, partial [Campylobacter upsaliensis]